MANVVAALKELTSNITLKSFGMTYEAKQRRRSTGVSQQRARAPNKQHLAPVTAVQLTREHNV
jgi:hypothetical protein